MKYKVKILVMREGKVTPLKDEGNRFVGGSHGDKVSISTAAEQHIMHIGDKNFEKNLRKLIERLNTTEYCDAMITPKEQWGFYLPYHCTRKAKYKHAGKHYCGIHIKKVK